MLAYIIRRLLYAIPILVGVNLLTFVLFFVVTSPDDMAVSQLGDKYVTPEAIETWKRKNGYHLPLFFNDEAPGLDSVTQTIFYTKSVKLFAFDFGRSESGRDITTDVSTRMWPSLAVALPTFAIGIWVNICVALLVIMFRATRLDRWVVFAFVVLMSISYLFYIIGGQYLVAKTWSLVPISGFHAGSDMWKFLVLPVLVGVVAGIGSGARWYRTLFLEEANQDYVRTARAKGLSERIVVTRHAFRNAMIPIATIIAFDFGGLIGGAVITETVFAWKGMGAVFSDALRAIDVNLMMGFFLVTGTLAVIFNIIADLLYSALDPRIRVS